MDLQVGGASKFKVEKTGSLNIANGSFLLRDNVSGTNEMRFLNNGLVFRAVNEAFVLKIRTEGVFAHTGKYIGFGDVAGGVPDTSLFQDAAGILAQRNGTTAQAFRVYNTYTDASNYERLNIQWSGNAMRIFPSAAGSGTPRIVYLGSDAIASTAFLVDSASNLLQMNTGGLNRWQVNSSGHFLANTDNLYDIGASGANRPRNIYTAGNIIPNGALAFSSQGQITAPAGSVYITGSGENMSGASNYIKSTNSSPFVIGTNNTERLTVTSAGNVGVGDIAAGTRTPSAPFEVIKSTAVNGPMLVLRGDISGAGKWSSIAWGDQTQTNAFRKGAIIYESLNASVRGKLHISLNNTDGSDSAGLSDARLTIAADGAVGVGASSPVNKLDIAETWNTIINVTGASGSGTIANITFATRTEAVPIGSTIVVAGINPAGYNGTFVVIASSTTALTYANATTTTYVSGGTIERVFTSVKLNVTDTASNAASKLMDLQVGGVSKFNFRKDGTILGDGASPLIQLSQSNGSKLAWGGSFVGCGVSLQLFSNDGNIQLLGTNLKIASDGTGILAQRDGVLKQVFRVYNTNLSGAPEWGGFDWQTTSNTLRIGTDKSGTGASHPIDFVVGGVVRMSIDTSGNITGTPGTTIGGSSVLSVIGAGNFRFSGRSAIYSTADGNLTLFNNFSTGFNLLTLGGITSAFPAIKRNGTGIDIRLADDSAFAPLTASTVVASTTTIGPAGLNLGNSAGTISLGGTRLDLGTATTTAVQLFSGSTGSPMLLFGGVASAHPAFKRSGTGIHIKLADDSEFAPISSLYQRFGSNTPEGAVTAPVGAVYHRTDSGAHPNFYVKESGSGANGWVGK
jgi:hypothetical protein